MENQLQPYFPFINANIKKQITQFPSINMEKFLLHELTTSIMLTLVFVIRLSKTCFGYSIFLKCKICKTSKQANLPLPNEILLN